MCSSWDLRPSWGFRDEDVGRAGKLTKLSAEDMQVTLPATNNGAALAAAPHPSRVQVHPIT